jgi:alkylation response protein AidB-like acyl-CoA dehydrogenase
MTTSESHAVMTTLTECDVALPPHGIGVSLAGPTILEHGTEQQRERFLPAIAAGEEGWCQLFSEPNAGSDLASLQTKAVRDGEQWLVNGQKVWSSGAQWADRGMLIARTDLDRPRHDGISYFLLEMDQPGVQVRPLRQMNGQSEFNEVFLTEARVGADALLGPLHGGWAVALTTLRHERAAEAPPRGWLIPAGRRVGNRSRILAELRSTRPSRRDETRATMYSRSGRAAARLALRFGRTSDPVIRQKIARLHELSETLKWTTARTSGAAASVAKLAAANLARQARDLSFEIMGAYGMLGGDDAPEGGSVHLMALSSYAVSIGGGTDEIQRNIIGERVLGLPREPEPDVGALSRGVAANRRPVGRGTGSTERS